MLFLLNIVYVLIAIAMIALILMQRGAGAQAGSGFGGGASATVFGSRGASNFLSKSTKWLAVAFFSISLFMAWSASQRSAKPTPADLGVMSQVPVAPSQSGAGVPAASVPAAPTAAPSAAPSTVPQAPAAQPAPSDAQKAPQKPIGG